MFEIEPHTYKKKYERIRERIAEQSFQYEIARELPPNVSCDDESVVKQGTTYVGQWRNRAPVKLLLAGNELYGSKLKEARILLICTFSSILNINKKVSASLYFLFNSRYC
ncbi:hypothetical protein Pfo_000624 [Paulownia fortunei]|nr:hypothetical protein Pfo_000624 [Paulownia fortunei]